jgi:hypothetical protein
MTSSSAPLTVVEGLYGNKSKEADGIIQLW